VRAWSELNRRHTSIVEGRRAPDANEEYRFYQTLVGCWPTEPFVPDDAFRTRITAYLVKALREAKVHTNWLTPDEDYERAVAAFVDQLLSPRRPFLGSFLPFHRRVAEIGVVNSLAQLLIKCTAPGVPDFYQGTELWDLHLVDPDNRRPVDYAARTEALKTLRHPKIRVVAAALRLRRERTATFTDGGYTPVLADGPAAEHLVAFLRADDVLTAVSRLTVLLSETGWGDTALALPPGEWTDRISGGRFSGRTLAAGLFADLPVALLERTDG